MKSKIAALSLLLATVSGQAALAQDHDRDHDRGGRPESGRGQRPGGGGGLAPAPRPQPQVQAAPPQRERPQGERPQGERRQGERPGGERPQGQRPQGERPQGARPGGWQGRPQGRPDGQPAPIPSQDWSNGHARYGAGQPDRDGRRPDWNRGRDRNGDGRPDWNRNGDRGGRPGYRPGPSGDHRPPQWDRHRYPPAYHSAHRYRGPAWYPPMGFYAHSWAFGEYLPQGWYSDQYVLTDWWNYDLPEPPPGLIWVRVGPDALLVDEDSGEVFQAVRALFY